MKLYVVFGNNRMDDTEGQTFGVFYNKKNAINKAIEVATESFDFYDIDRDRRSCYYYDKPWSEEDRKNGYVFCVEDDSAYKTYIRIRAVEFINHSNLKYPPSATITWGTPYRDAPEYYPLEEAYSSAMEASLYMLDMGISFMNYADVKIKNRYIEWDNNGFINAIIDGEDYKVELHTQTWCIEDYEEFEKENWED